MAFPWCRRSPINSANITDSPRSWRAPNPELLILRRRRPSGVPDETREVAHGPDPTWAADIRHFEAMVATGVTSCENDLWLSRAVHAAAAGSLEGGS